MREVGLKALTLRGIDDELTRTRLENPDPDER